MREPKFRAWDKVTNKYYVVSTLEYADNGELCEVWLADIPITETNDACRNPKDVILEQYTGLKDKNDKEIAVGDIVKARWLRAKNARLNTRGEVKFGGGWFYIYDDPDGQDRLGAPIHNCYQLEIVGNIHENPELLEEEE